MFKDGTGEVEDGTAKTGVVKNQDGCNRFLAPPVFFHSECKKTVFLHTKNLNIARAKIRFFVTPAFKNTVFLHALIYIILLRPTLVLCGFCHSCGPPDYLLDDENQPNGVTEAARESCFAKD